MVKSFNDNVVSYAKIYLSAINGVGDDVRLSKRRNLSKKTGVLKGVKLVLRWKYHWRNYAAALNLETNLPNLIPDDYNADAIFFLDLANVWGVTIQVQ